MSADIQELMAQRRKFATEHERAAREFLTSDRNIARVLLTAVRNPNNETGSASPERVSHGLVYWDELSKQRRDARIHKEMPSVAPSWQKLSREETDMLGGRAHSFTQNSAYADLVARFNALVKGLADDVETETPFFNTEDQSAADSLFAMFFALSQAMRDYLVVDDTEAQSALLTQLAAQCPHRLSMDVSARLNRLTAAMSDIKSGRFSHRIQGDESTPTSWYYEVSRLTINTPFAVQVTQFEAFASKFTTALQSVQQQRDNPDVELPSFEERMRDTSQIPQLVDYQLAATIFRDNLTVSLADDADIIQCKLNFENLVSDFNAQLQLYFTYLKVRERVEKLPPGVRALAKKQMHYRHSISALSKAMTDLVWTYSKIWQPEHEAFLKAGLITGNVTSLKQQQVQIFFANAVQFDRVLCPDSVLKDEFLYDMLFSSSTGDYTSDAAEIRQLPMYKLLGAYELKQLAHEKQGGKHAERNQSLLAGVEQALAALAQLPVAQENQSVNVGARTISSGEQKMAADVCRTLSVELAKLEANYQERRPVWGSIARILKTFLTFLPSLPTVSRRERLSAKMLGDGGSAVIKKSVYLTKTAERAAALKRRYYVSGHDGIVAGQETPVDPLNAGPNGTPPPKRVRR